MFTYFTNFKLSNPVLDIDEANYYLHENDMTFCLFQDIGELKEIIKDIKWNLTTPLEGKVIINSNRELTNEEKVKISNFISDQNADGIGEGFEQQSFAYYTQEEYDQKMGYNVSYDDEEGECESICSFDWRNNDYELYLLE